MHGDRVRRLRGLPHQPDCRHRQRPGAADPVVAGECGGDVAGAQEQYQRGGVLDGLACALAQILGSSRAASPRRTVRFRTKVDGILVRS